MSDRSPIHTPHWQALSREAKLVRELIGAGVTALGKANYADGKGNYYVGFFNLSIGLERLAKLILIADYIIENNGAPPPPELVKRFGHRIQTLLDNCDQISKKHKLKLRYKKPEGEISNAIVYCLDCFSNAQRGRYANIEEVGDPNFQAEFEPIRLWWTVVAKKILEKHFTGTSNEKNVQIRAQQITNLLGPYAHVLYFSEDGSQIDDVQVSLELTGKAEYVKKFWRYYTLIVVRWLSDVFDSASHYGCYEQSLSILFGHYEHFQTYRVDDSFLKSRKVWPLT